MGTDLLKCTMLNGGWGSWLGPQIGPKGGWGDPAYVVQNDHCVALMNICFPRLVFSNTCFVLSLCVCSTGVSICTCANVTIRQELVCGIIIELFKRRGIMWIFGLESLLLGETLYWFTL